MGTFTLSNPHILLPLQHESFILPLPKFYSPCLPPTHPHTTSITTSPPYPHFPYPLLTPIPLSILSNPSTTPIKSASLLCTHPTLPITLNLNLLPTTLLHTLLNPQTSSHPTNSTHIISPLT